MKEFANGAEQVTMFCRLNMNIKRDIPIRPSEMGMLIYLVKSEGENTPLKIAEFFKVTKPNVTAMINSTLKKGYVEKVISEKDKRSFILIPTEKAIALVDETYMEYFKTMELLMSKMGKEDYNSLVSLLEIANNILVEEKSNE